MYYIHTYTSDCYEGQFRLHKIALIHFKKNYNHALQSTFKENLHCIP